MMYVCVFRFIVFFTSSSESKVVDTRWSCLFCFWMAWKSLSVWTPNVLSDNVLGFPQSFDQNSAIVSQIKTLTLLHTFLSNYYWMIIQLLDAVTAFCEPFTTCRGRWSCPYASHEGTNYSAPHLMEVNYQVQATVSLPSGTTRPPHTEEQAGWTWELVWMFS